MGSTINPDANRLLLTFYESFDRFITPESRVNGSYMVMNVKQTTQLIRGLFTRNTIYVINLSGHSMLMAKVLSSQDNQEYYILYDSHRENDLTFNTVVTSSEDDYVRSMHTYLTKHVLTVHATR